MLRSRRALVRRPILFHTPARSAGGSAFKRQRTSYYGADRTGVMVAAFRMATQNWTPQQALAEMKEFHFHNFLHHHLKAYIEDFPRQLETDPALRTFHHAAQTSAP